MNDERVWVFAEWIGEAYAPKYDNNVWVPGYHDLLYNLTDDAIQVCPSGTKWLVVTNGDNEYGSSFTRRVDHEYSVSGAEVVAFDFYSRYQRPTEPPCDRFAAWADVPSCKRNRMKWCHTDLGAYAVDYRKFLEEDRLFGSLHASSQGLDASHFDGILAETLIREGWKLAHVNDACMFSHSPNPQDCGWSGGVWDDSDMRGSGGGRCIDWQERTRLLTEDADGLEEVIVWTSTDGHANEFAQGDAWNGTVRCIRKKGHVDALEIATQRAWFGRRCADDESGDFERQLEWEARHYNSVEQQTQQTAHSESKQVSQEDAGSQQREELRRLKKRKLLVDKNGKVKKYIDPSQVEDWNDLQTEYRANDFTTVPYFKAKYDGPAVMAAIPKEPITTPPHKV